MYVLSCRVTPSGGGEICRAASICVLAIEIRKADPRAKDTTLMYEVSGESVSLKGSDPVDDS